MATSQYCPDLTLSKTLWRPELAPGIMERPRHEWITGCRALELEKISLNDSLKTDRHLQTHPLLWATSYFRYMTFCRHFFWSNLSKTWLRQDSHMCSVPSNCVCKICEILCKIRQDSLISSYIFVYNLDSIIRGLSSLQLISSTLSSSGLTYFRHNNIKNHHNNDSNISLFLNILHVYTLNL